jgi:hypothetical protein
LRPWFEAIKEKNASVRTRLKSITPVNLDELKSNYVSPIKKERKVNKRSKSTVTNKDLTTTPEIQQTEDEELGS